MHDVEQIRLPGALEEAGTQKAPSLAQGPPRVARRALEASTATPGPPGYPGLESAGSQWDRRPPWSGAEELGTQTGGPGAAGVGEGTPRSGATEIPAAVGGAACRSPRTASWSTRLPPAQDAGTARAAQASLSTQLAHGTGARNPTARRSRRGGTGYVGILGSKDNPSERREVEAAGQSRHRVGVADPTPCCEDRGRLCGSLADPAPHHVTRWRDPALGAGGTPRWIKPQPCFPRAPRPCRAEECVGADQGITPGVRHPVWGLAVCGGNPVENEASVLPLGKLGSPRLCGRPGWTEPPAFPCVKGTAASCLPCARQRRGSAAEEAGASGRRGGQRVTAAGAEQSGGSTLPAVLAAPRIPGLVVTALQSLPLFSHDLCPHAPNLTLLSLSRRCREAPLKTSGGWQEAATGQGTAGITGRHKLEKGSSLEPSEGA
ncbi:collagen alpha-1(I) chain-like [Panthera leo]|uniref:collagen alpha-1(I) chain-like n=1 Tax=Panthera leo TaxID=9689 RepID=UPI001C6A29B0|nr:collagen alpha-1(I) chain-like [Panthera leo]